MPVGKIEEVPEYIRRLGFKIEEKITVLGLILEQNSMEFTQSCKRIEDKIKAQIRFWDGFYLSLPGRITVNKTMLYSQINYLGCFLPVPEQWIMKFQKLINGYVMGRTKISLNRLCDRPEHGGLGIFELDSFLSAQKCVWIKRARNLDELWKIRIYSKSLGSVLNIRK